jgi:factor associated with neutral sphingomyelinase activation
MIFQPEGAALPMLKFKLSNSDLQYSFVNANLTEAPKLFGKKSDRVVKPRRRTSFADVQSCLELRVKSFLVISRVPLMPQFCQTTKGLFTFELNERDVTRVNTELELVMNYEDEEKLVNLIYSVRFKEKAALLQTLPEFGTDEALLHHKCTRVLLEGQQLGLFALSPSCLLFSPLVNARPRVDLSINMKSVQLALKYRYLGMDVGLRLEVAQSCTVLLLFETEEQRDGIYAYLQHKAKFSDALEMLPSYTLQWQTGLLTNFEYVMLLNNVASRCTLDLRQYPVFPWVLRQLYGEELDLADSKNYRDLGVPVAALNTERLEQAMQRKTASEEHRHSSFYSNASTVLYYLIRQFPEFIIKRQNSIIGSHDRIFKSIERAFRSSLTLTGDFKETVPEFYTSNSSFLINSELMQLDEEPLADVELPLWAKDSTHFSELMEQAFESDSVSADLSSWIDLVFGFKQRGEQASAADNLFSESVYSSSWRNTDVQRKASEALAAEFGQSPTQLFTHPHPRKLIYHRQELSRPLLEKYQSSQEEVLEHLQTELAKLKH